MQFGDDYSQFYDHFYDAKDYQGEVRFVLSRIATILKTQDDLKILDLGCGTGRHAFDLVRLGHRVHGVDLSPQMLQVAETRREALEPDVAGRVSFQTGDIRKEIVDDGFDVVICLFHVLCYLQPRQEILAAFANARRHAKAGAAYLFDFWHGPAVLTNPPTLRDKSIVTNGTTIRRISTPTWHKDVSLVAVDYTLEATDSATGTTEISHERHIVRYLFPDEVRDWLAQSGFEVVEVGEWMTGLSLTSGSFSAYVLARCV